MLCYVADPWDPMCPVLVYSRPVPSSSIPQNARDVLYISYTYFASSSSHLPTLVSRVSVVVSRPKRPNAATYAVPCSTVDYPGALPLSRPTLLSRSRSVPLLPVINACARACVRTRQLVVCERHPSDQTQIRPHKRQFSACTSLIRRVFLHCHLRVGQAAMHLLPQQNSQPCQP